MLELANWRTRWKPIMPVAVVKEQFMAAGGSADECAGRSKPQSRTAGSRCILPAGILCARRPGRTCLGSQPPRVIFGFHLCRMWGGNEALGLGIQDSEKCG